MRLTWFGGTTFRIHIGGRIVVVDAAALPPPFDRQELLSGSERVLELAGTDDEEFDARTWSARRAATALEDDVLGDGVLVHRLDAGAVLLDAAGEAPLVLMAAPVGVGGRWTRDAVVVVAGDAALAGVALDGLAPRLLVLAAPAEAVEAAIMALRDRLDGTGLVALEPGLALEL